MWLIEGPPCEALEATRSPGGIRCVVVSGTGSGVRADVPAPWRAAGRDEDARGEGLAAGGFAPGAPIRPIVR